jgi:hypothetical protein
LSGCYRNPTMPGPIDRKRLDKRLRQKAGHEDLEAFLERVRPDVQAIELFLWSCGILVRNPGEKWLPLTLRLVLTSHYLARNSAHLLPFVDDVVDWFGLHEDEYRGMHARGLEALTRLAEAHRKIIDRRVATDRRGDHLPVSVVFVNWFELHEDEYHRVHARGLKALTRLAKYYRAIASQHTSNARRKAKARRKAEARSGALLARLEDTRDVLAAFVEDYPRVMAWIRDVLSCPPSCISRAGG